VQDIPFWTAHSRLFQAECETGPTAGSNVFRIQAGDVTKEVTIVSAASRTPIAARPC